MEGYPKKKLCFCENIQFCYLVVGEPVWVYVDYTQRKVVVARLHTGSRPVAFQSDVIV